MRTYIITFFVICLAGCSLSPVPVDIENRHSRAKNHRKVIEHLLQPGDLIFRQGEALVAGGQVNFSALVAEISNSDFSHAVIVHKIVDGEAILTDVSVLGLQRFFFIDWLMDGQKNLVVKRLNPEHRHLLPTVLYNLDQLVEDDPLYDDKFGDGSDGKFYCTGAVDRIFRMSGLPLAEKVRMRDLPNFDKMWILIGVVEPFLSFNLDSEVAIAGNDDIGLFSSPYLETVIDLRDDEALPL